jgi:hypothetical protein
MRLKSFPIIDIMRVDGLSLRFNSPKLRNPPKHPAGIIAERKTS